MRLLILTSGLDGTAAHHLPRLMESGVVDEVTVVFSRGEIKDQWKYYRRKLNKVLKIGLRGALNGKKMRSWYSEDVKNYTSISRLDAYCASKGIAFTAVPRINGPECRQAFEEFAPDIAISLGNGYIGSKVFTIPTHGMLNIHHEMLPQYQNAQSVIWQLYNGSRTSGYTIHRIDKRIDTGEIVKQEEVPIRFEATLAETVSATVAALYDASAEGLTQVLSDLPSHLEAAEPQGHGQSYTTPTAAQMKKIHAQWESLRGKQPSTD